MVEICYTISIQKLVGSKIRAKEKPLEIKRSQVAFMAAGEGFEPSHTESESAVLPLHNPAKRKKYYTDFFQFVKYPEEIIL